MQTRTRGWMLGWSLAAVWTVGAAESALDVPPASMDATETETEKPAAWNIAAGAQTRVYIYTHDALQHRADYEADKSERWRDGSSDGLGWGLHAAISRGGGILDLTLMLSDYDFDYRDDNCTHKISTTRRDVIGIWRQPTDSNDWAAWGWTVGARYLGTTKEIRITESEDVLEESDGVTWYLITGGYYGEVRPFRGERFRAYGDIGLLFGEASGLARNGNDTAWADGRIRDEYTDQHALAYGLDGVVGLAYAFPQHFLLRLDYRREWLYSFAATETGIVTFPDNADALFMEIQHSVTASLEYRF